MMVFLKILIVGFSSIGSVFAYRTIRDTSIEEQRALNTRNNALDPEQIKTLRLVTLVLRHGNRNPQDTYPNDPYINNPMEPYGWGQLTSKGRLNQYNQGLFLRKRYNEFLGTKYNPDLFWLQSTEPDRAQMSALLEAAALWKPTEQQKFKSDLAWQPIPLHYEPRDTDKLLLIWSTCPDYARMRALAENSYKIQEINNQNKELYAELTNLTGHAIANVDDVFSLYGTLYAENDIGLKLPDWTQNYFPNKLLPLSIISLELNVYNETLRKQKCSPLVTKIVNDMNQKAEGTLKPKDRKMFMYVGHDSTVVAALAGMNVWDKQVPGYNTMVMIELHEIDSEWKVQIYLRNSTEQQPIPLTIPGCEFSCSLNKFNELLKPIILSPEQWKMECALKDSNFVEMEAPPP